MHNPKRRTRNSFSPHLPTEMLEGPEVSFNLSLQNKYIRVPVCHFKEEVNKKVKNKQNMGANSQ